MLDLTTPIAPGVGAGEIESLDELRRHVGDAPPDERREWDRWGGEIVRYSPMSFTPR
jgi:hypothetical protein